MTGPAELSAQSDKEAAPGVVLDCSVAVGWCFEDEASPEADALFARVRDEGAVVPALWYLEIANVLLQAEKRGRIRSGDVAIRLDLMAALPITTDGETSVRAWRETLTLARAEALTVYDAAYLEVATRRGLPLMTRDAALIRAARRVGVPVLPDAACPG